MNMRLSFSNSCNGIGHISALAFCSGGPIKLLESEAAECSGAFGDGLADVDQLYK